MDFLKDRRLPALRSGRIRVRRSRQNKQQTNRTYAWSAVMSAESRKRVSAGSLAIYVR
jgi:hypothetical protein